MLGTGFAPMNMYDLHTGDTLSLPGVHGDNSAHLDWVLV